MRAMVLEAAGSPLQLREVEAPRPRAGRVQIRVTACGVCRTDLHILDGELSRPKLPLIPGHQIVGVVLEAMGDACGLAPGIPVHTEVEVFPLAAANEALFALRAGRIRGSAVLEIRPS